MLLPFTGTYEWDCRNVVTTSVVRDEQSGENRGVCNGCWVSNLSMSGVGVCQHIIILTTMSQLLRGLDVSAAPQSFRDFAMATLSQDNPSTVARVDSGDAACDKQTYVVVMRQEELYNLSNVVTPDEYAVCDFYVRRPGYVLASCKMCRRGKVRADRKGVRQLGQHTRRVSGGAFRDLICVHMWKVMSSGVGRDMGAGWRGTSFHEVGDVDSEIDSSDLDSAAHESASDYEFCQSDDPDIGEVA